MTEREQLIAEIGAVLENQSQHWVHRGLLLRCRAALEAVPVPREPTEAMLTAHLAVWNSNILGANEYGVATWRAMYDAAMQSSEPKEGGGDSDE